MRCTSEWICEDVSRKVHMRWQSHPAYGQHHHMHSGPRLNEKGNKEISQLSFGLDLSLSPGGHQEPIHCHGQVCSYHADCIPQNCEPLFILKPLSCFLTRKVTRIRPSEGSTCTKYKVPVGMIVSLFILCFRKDDARDGDGFMSQPLGL